MGLTIQRNIPTKFAGLYKPFREKVFHGGRGSAKSTSIADFLVLEGFGRTIRVLCTREIQKSLEASVYQLLVDRIIDHKLGPPELGGCGFYRWTRNGIFGANGTKFLFAGLKDNVDNIKSMEALDYIWIEEAHKTSQSSIDKLTPTLRKHGSELLVSFNREKATDPIDVRYLGGKPPPNSHVVMVNWRDNRYFPKVLYDEMMWMKERDYDKYLHVWEGHPLKYSAATVFRNWETGDIDEQIPGGTPIKYGADWGFSVDPSVLVGMYVWQRTLYIRHEAWKVQCEIDELPSLFAGTDDRTPSRWENTHKHVGLPNARRTRIVADSQRPDTISYMKKRGFDIRRAIKGPRSVEEGVEFIKSYDVVIHPSCKHVIDEFKMYQYKIDPLTEEVLPELADKDNHVIDACRYALEDIRRKRGGNYATPVHTRSSVYRPQLYTA